VSATEPAVTRHDEIVGAAVRLFSEQGYPVTTVRDIADAVGLLPGSLYVHIDSKESLLLQIVEDAIDRYLEACEAAAATDSPADVRFRDVIRVYMKVAAEEPQRTLVALHQWKHLKGEGRDRVVKKRRRFEAIFNRLIQEGVKEGVFSDGVRPAIPVLMIIGALNWAPEWFSPAGPQTPEAIGDEFANIMLQGIRRVSSRD
jgi:AcrR family transcriptional regulator